MKYVRRDDDDNTEWPVSTSVFWFSSFIDIIGVYIIPHKVFLSRVFFFSFVDHSDKMICNNIVKRFVNLVNRLYIYPSITKKTGYFLDVNRVPFNYKIIKSTKINSKKKKQIFKMQLINTTVFSGILFKVYAI